MIRRSLLMLLTAALLSGCGAGRLPISGSPFSAPQMTLAPGWSAAPAITQDDPRGSSLLARQSGGFALAYETRKLGGKDVFVTLSADGERWSAPVAVGKTPRTEQEPALWEDASGTLHLIYASNESGRFQLYASSSTDGQEWSQPVAFTKESDQANSPSVTVTPGGGVAVAYENVGGECLVIASSDGEVWGLSRRIDASGGDPAIAHDGEGLRVVFHRDEQLFERREREGAWSEAIRLPGSAGMREPSLARVGGTLKLAYSVAGSNGEWKLALRDGGPTDWGQEQVLVQGPDDHGFPSLAAGRDGGSWLAWGISRLTEERGIFVARSGGR